MSQAGLLRWAALAPCVTLSGHPVKDGANLRSPGTVLEGSCDASWTPRRKSVDMMPAAESPPAQAEATEDSSRTPDSSPLSAKGHVPGGSRELLALAAPL